MKYGFLAVALALAAGCADEIDSVLHGGEGRIELTPGRYYVTETVIADSCTLAPQGQEFSVDVASGENTVTLSSIELSLTLVRDGNDLSTQVTDYRSWDSAGYDCIVRSVDDYRGEIRSSEKVTMRHDRHLERSSGTDCEALYETLPCESSAKWTVLLE